MREIEVIAGHLSSPRPRRSADPQKGYHGFDLPPFPGGERDFELRSQFVALKHVYQRLSSSGEYHVTRAS